MSEMVHVQPDYEMTWKLSQKISNTPFVPSALRGKNEAVLACILYGAELGLGPMQSLNSIHVIEGRTAMSPELMRAMVAKHGHRIDVIENSNTACEVKGTRADTGSTATVRWTMEDAKLAGLAGKNNWRTYPRAMLLARATSELCRIVFPDVIAGLSYTPEEVASIEGVDYVPEVAAPVESEPIAVIAPVEPEIQEAELIEPELEEPAPLPKERRTKIGENAKMKPIDEKVEEIIENGVTPTANPNVPPFEERESIAKSWGAWPFVKGVTSAVAKKKQMEMPINYNELAWNEELWLEVSRVMEMKKK